MTEAQFTEARAMIDEWKVRADAALQEATNHFGNQQSPLTVGEGYMNMHMRIAFDRERLIEALIKGPRTPDIVMLRTDDVVDEELAALMASLRAHIYRPGDASADSSPDL